MEDKIFDYWHDDFCEKYDCGRNRPASYLSDFRSDPDFVKFESDLKNYIIKNHKKQLGWKVSGVFDEYIDEVIGGRWYEMEPIILDSLDMRLAYCEEVVNGRWLELEERLVKDKDFEGLSYYAENMIKNRWDEFEKVAINKLKRADVEEKEDIVSDIRCYCNSNKFRWPEFEDYLVNGIDYAKIDKNISKSLLEQVLRYGLDVVEGRWEEAEHLFIKRIDVAKRYIMNKKFKWPLYENRIKNKPNGLYYYAKDVLEGKLPEELHNRMIMERMGDNAYARSYFDFLKTKEETVIRYLSCMTKEEKNNFLNKVI